MKFVYDTPLTVQEIQRRVEEAEKADGRRVVAVTLDEYEWNSFAAAINQPANLISTVNIPRYRNGLHYDGLTVRRGN